MLCLNLNLSSAWSGEKASFGGCIAFSPGCSDSEAVKAAAELWPKAVFCNAFWKALEATGVEDNGPASRASLVRLICQLQDCMPRAGVIGNESIKVVTDAVTLALEGLFALADPSVCSGSLEAV